jgi:hypothetical protein
VALIWYGIDRIRMMMVIMLVVMMMTK